MPTETMQVGPRDVATMDAVKEPSYAELKARIAQLEAEKAKKQSTQLHFKVGEKGGVCVIGLNTFPVTLYIEQWQRLFEALPRLQEFIAVNRHLLKSKGA